MKKIVLSVIAVLFCFFITAQDGANLKLSMEKNKLYRFRSTSNQNLSQTVNGVLQTTNTSSNTVFSIKMVDATNDFIIVEARFDTVVINTNAMGKMVSMNSASPGNMASSEAADVMSCIMNRLSKNVLYVKMDATGKVIDIVNFTMLSDIVLKDTASITGQSAPVLKTQVKNTINVKALKSMIEAFTFNLPDKEVKNGEQWEINSPFNSGGMSLDIVTSYKLNDINNNNAHITSESSIKASVDAEPLEYSGARITYDGLTGMGKSNLIIDSLTGLVIENNSKTHMAGDLNVSVQGMNLQIPMEIDGESKVVALL